MMEEDDEESAHSRWKRKQRHVEEYYYKHFTSKVYSKGLLQDQINVFDVGISEQDEIEGCCPACCRSVRRTCVTCGALTVISWLPVIIYVIIHLTTSIRLHDKQLTGNTPTQQAFQFLLLSAFIGDLVLGPTLILASKKGWQILCTIHIIGGSIQVFLFFTIGILAANNLDSDDSHGLEATLYLLLFSIAGSRSLYFTIQSYGLYLLISDARLKKISAMLTRSSSMTTRSRVAAANRNLENQNESVP